MDVICTNEKFPEEALRVYRKYGVVTPEEGKLYTIRDVTRHSTGKVGLRLEEIVNPPIPFSHPILGNDAKMEPTWAIERFRTLLGDIISEETLKELLNEKNSITITRDNDGAFNTSNSHK